MKHRLLAVLPARRPFYGWVIVTVASIVSFSEVAMFNPVLSVFLKPMTQELGWSRASLSFAVTLGALGAGMIGPLIGRFIDRWGPRLALVAATLVVVISLLGLSFVAELWQFYLFFTIGRIMTQGVTSLAVLVAISNWFIKKRGRSIGITVLGTRAGMAVLPLMVQFIMDASSWRVAWLVLALAVLVLTQLPSLLLMRRRPEDMGLRPDGREREDQGNGAASVAARGEASAKEEPQWSLSEALHTKSFWLLVLAVSQGFLVLGSLNLHTVAYLTDRGIAATAAVGALSLAAVTGAISSLIWGFLGERIPLRYLLSFVLLLFGGAVVFLLQVDSEFLAFIFGLLDGLALGGILTLTRVVWADYFGRASVGSIWGVVTVFQYTLNAIGPLLAGWLFDVTGNYLLAFLIFTVSSLMAAFWAFLAKPPCRVPPPAATA